MSIKEVTYYQVQCDEPDCGVTTEDLGGDFSAYGDGTNAVDDWLGDGQEIEMADGTTRHYCTDHTKDVCDNCDSTTDIDAASGLCPTCLHTTEGAAR